MGNRNRRRNIRWNFEGNLLKVKRAESSNKFGLCKVVLCSVLVMIDKTQSNPGYSSSKSEKSNVILVSFAIGF